jgi:hypothetical protein
VKAGGNQSNLLLKISDYVGRRRETEDSKSVPIGSPVGQNEPPAAIGGQIQRSEPIGDKNWIISMVLRRPFY